MFSNDENFLSNNEHFCKSALSNFSQNEFIDLVKNPNVKFHEKKLSQLFCYNSAKDIIQILITEYENQNVEMKINAEIKLAIRKENLNILETIKVNYLCSSIVVAAF